MRTGKTLIGVLLMSVLASGAFAADEKKPTLAPGQIVIGGNLSPGMPLNQAIEVLGIPDKVKVVRGASQDRDSIKITYAQHGLVLRAMSNGTQIEGIEIGPTFKGTFKSESGIKLGVKYEMVIGEYGLPSSLTAQVMRYPERGIYFQLNNERLLSAKTYAKGTKLMDANLMNP
ncbi:MAG: hypothetical protein IIA63_03845 [Nitrospinae bacterium]|nr:hypothetical protein [Nitrospinota bacterium]TDJ48878.1 MAG: hypothetical protein E2O45_05665 [Nitrospina sp.]MCH7499537.1 hypothetical protein [Nitrospinota bacterium]MCH7650276.1 hypothetical protein [Nitrospinota bacterium]MCH8932059.1 hypothetical protein [Nitrospinota bacterium]